MLRSVDVRTTNRWRDKYLALSDWKRFLHLSYLQQSVANDNNPSSIVTHIMHSHIYKKTLSVSQCLNLFSCVRGLNHNNLRDLPPGIWNFKQANLNRNGICIYTLISEIINFEHGVIICAGTSEDTVYVNLTKLSRYFVACYLTLPSLQSMSPGLWWRIFWMTVCNVKSFILQ